MASDVVLAVVLDFTKNSLEDVLGQDVLQQHLPHVGLGDRWADAAVTQLEELGDASPVSLVAYLGIRHCLSQVFQHRRQVRGKLLAGLSELPDLR